jgi:hypothetical protein
MFAVRDYLGQVWNFFGRVLSFFDKVCCFESKVGRFLGKVRCFGCRVDSFASQVRRFEPFFGFAYKLTDFHAILMCWDGIKYVFRTYFLTSRYILCSFHSQKNTRRVAYRVSLFNFSVIPSEV